MKSNVYSMGYNTNVVDNCTTLSAFQGRIFHVALAWSNLVLLTLILKVYSFNSSTVFLLNAYVLILHIAKYLLAVSTNKGKLEAIITSASCAALILLFVGAVFAYQCHRHLYKFKPDVFFDVAGKNLCLDIDICGMVS